MTDSESTRIDVELVDVHDQKTSVKELGFKASHPLQIVFTDLTYSVQVPKKPTPDDPPSRPWQETPMVTKTILHGVNGVFHPGRLTAIMGASGSGKTSLLNLVAGALRSSRGQMSGKLLVNGEELSMRDKKLKKSCGYVQQDDVILETMTVREAIMMAALLRLPRAMSLENKIKRVEEVIDMMHLRHCADSIIGGHMNKGISGGERKRVSVAMVMITNPGILYLDEPTSGLDTYTAYSLIRTLRDVARTGRTVVATIHQPNSDIFHLFDDLVLLSEGKIVYVGPCGRMVDYFAQLGYHCPLHHNPADYLFMNILNNWTEMEVGGEAQVSERQGEASPLTVTAPSSLEPGGKEGSGDHKEKLEQLARRWLESEQYGKLVTTIQKPQTGGLVAGEVAERAPFNTQFNLLSLRAYRNAVRNKLMVKGRLMQSIIMALIIGLIYYDLSDTQRSVQDRQGSLFFISVNGLMASTMQVLSIFAAEKAVFRREYDSGLYGLPAYFISRTVVELPFKIFFPFLSGTIMYWMIGYRATAAHYFILIATLILVENAGTALGVFVASFFQDIGVALAVVPVFLMPLMIFSGFMVNTASLPVWLQWIPYISPVKYAFTAVILNEFEGETFRCAPDEYRLLPGQTTGVCPITHGSQVITLLGFNNDGSVGVQLVVLACLFFALNTLAYIALRRQLKKQN